MAATFVDNDPRPRSRAGYPRLAVVPLCGHRWATPNMAPTCEAGYMTL